MSHAAATRTLARELWSMDPLMLEEGAAAFTAQQFAETEGAVPVLIAAHNEAQDLPATLVSLAGSAMNVRPYVVDNNSTDRTGDIARKMGAIHISEPRLGKIRAIKTGLEAIFEDGSNQTVLFTDADTIVGGQWAEVMTRRCIGKVGATGAFATGMVSFVEGQNRRTDITRNVFAAAAQYKRRLREEPPAARGANMAIRFNPALQEAIMAVDDTVFPGADCAMRDAAMSAGAEGIFIPDGKANVASRGDRFPSITAFLLSSLKIIERKDFYDPALTAGMTPYQRLEPLEQPTASL